MVPIANGGLRHLRNEGLRIEQHQMLQRAALIKLGFDHLRRDPDPGRSIAPMYEPPPGFTPAEAGTIIDDSIHPRDITSTLVDLAVRGYLKIEEKIETTLGLFHHKDYIFHLLKPESEWQGLAAHERVMLSNVFSGGSETRLSSLKNRFYTAIPVVREDIMATLKRKGVYLLDPESANGYSIMAAIVVVTPFLILQFGAHRSLFNSIGLVVVCGAISALIWWLFARQMTAKTVEGGRARKDSIKVVWIFLRLLMTLTTAGRASDPI